MKAFIILLTCSNFIFNGELFCYFIYLNFLKHQYNLQLLKHLLHKRRNSVNASLTGFINFTGVKAECSVKPPETFGYIGCFIDEENRDLKAIRIFTKDMNYENCTTVCKGYAYLGLQHGYE